MYEYYNHWFQEENETVTLTEKEIEQYDGDV